MAFGENLQFLRKRAGSLTQEQLAERLGVTRQTVSKWESNEALPEMDKLLALSAQFSCTLDALIKEDLQGNAEVYSDVRIVHVPAFRMARYVMISPNPEDDVNAYMDAWARKSGLLDVPGTAVRRIGWDFPFTSPELKNRFNLRGYVSACILPEGFEPRCGGAEIAQQDAATYAVITVRDPFAAAFERIPGAYRRLLEHLDCNGFKEVPAERILPCFEEVYGKDGLTCMDVYIHASSVGKGNLHTGF